MGARGGDTYVCDVDEGESTATGTAREEVGMAGVRGRLTTVLSNGRPEAEKSLPLAADLRFNSMRVGCQRKVWR